VLIYCVNDGAVMDAWAKDQGVDGSMVTFLADTRCELTKALDMSLTHPGVMAVLGNLRCKRFALLVVDGTVEAVEVSEGPDDPTGGGDELLMKSCAENMMKHVK